MIQKCRDSKASYRLEIYVGKGIKYEPHQPIRMKNCRLGRNGLLPWATWYQKKYKRWWHVQDLAMYAR